MPLIKLNDSLIVSHREIKRADRCGNYTNVWLYQGSALGYQIWDETGEVWAVIERATEGRTTGDVESAK